MFDTSLARLRVTGLLEGASFLVLLFIAMPLKYLAYFPAAVFLGKIPSDRLWMEIGIEFLWLGFFIVLARWMYARGLKRYSGYGG